MALLALAGLAAAGWAGWWFTAGRPVLAGDREHDFGLVELDGGPVTLEHTFTLANRRGAAVAIEDVATTCGCTVASTSADVVEPGGTLEIDAALKLTRHGRKDARILLAYAGGEVDELHLRAAARKRQRLMVVGRTVFYEDYESGDRPPPARIAAPPGVAARLSPWEQSMRLREARGLPARWRAKLELEVGGGADPAAAVTISVGPGQRVSVPVRAAPPGPGTPPGRPPAGR